MNNARETILESIRTHLAASVPHDKRELAVHPVDASTQVEQVSKGIEQVRKGGLPPLMRGRGQAPLPDLLDSGGGLVSGTDLGLSLVELFKESLEAVDGRCVIAHGEAEIARALTRIISEQKTNLRAQRIAISEVPLVERVMYQTDLEIEELAVAPNASDIFGFDVGITTAQAAIAETGTLVLDSADERHRLVSLVPPVHIAIVDASRICETLADALTLLRRGNEISRAVTFITGPSRTADIELTLTIGVHGPQELYVIVNSN